MQPEKTKELEIVANFSIVVRCPIYPSGNGEIQVQPSSQLKGSNLYFPLPGTVACMLPIKHPLQS